MIKQVPSKHDTTRTVISILPLATFHQWLIKLVDCSTLCANLTLVSLFFFFSNSCANSNWNWYCLKKVMCFLCEWMTGLSFLMYLLRKTKALCMVLLQFCTSITVEHVQRDCFAVFCWLIARWLSWIRWAGPLQLLKVGCWRDWSYFSFVLFIIDCKKKKFCWDAWYWLQDWNHMKSI